MYTRSVRGGGSLAAPKLAFTLAEVLITLGIIGVVAAMTMPVLILKYNEKVWLTGFKRVYSILNQAYLSVYQDIGIAKNWCDKNNNSECTQIYFDLLAPYFNISEVWDNSKRTKIFSKVKYRDLYGGNYNAFSSFSWFVLNDGTLVGLSYESELETPFLQVDINGLKRPNQLGKDLFFFTFNDRNDAPVLAGYSKWWVKDAVFCSQEQKSGWYSGGGCSLWIIATGNMDYLHRQITLEEWRNNVQRLIIKSGSSSFN